MSAEDAARGAVGIEPAKDTDEQAGSPDPYRGFPDDATEAEGSRRYRLPY